MSASSPGHAQRVRWSVRDGVRAGMGRRLTSSARARQAAAISVDSPAPRANQIRTSTNFANHNQRSFDMDIGRDRILVTGATGKQGGAVAHELLAKGHKVRAMTRHPESPAAKALAAAGAEVVAGNLDDESSLERPVAGAWGAFAIQNTW